MLDMQATRGVAVTRLLSAIVFLLFAPAAFAAETLPTKGVFTEVDSESELDFGKRELGFPDEECTFSSPKRITPAKWRIRMSCNRSEDRAVNQKETATLERKGKGWRLIRKDGARKFTLDFKP
jgi:hypothetical protein